MGISIYYLESFDISATVCRGLERDGFELIDFFSAINPLLHKLTANKSKKLVTATSNSISLIKEEANIFDNIHMLTSIGVSIKNNRIYHFTTSLEKFKAMLVSTDWQKIGLNVASKKALDNINEYRKKLLSSSVQSEIKRWNCFLMFLNKLVVLDDELSNLDLEPESLSQLEDKKLITRNKQNTGYVLSLDNINFKDKIINLYNLDVNYYNQNKIIHSEPSNSAKQSSIDKTETLNRFLQSNIRDIEIFEYRLQGDTLKDIGDRYGISRERTRQRFNKVLEKLPNIKEVEENKNLFKKYNIPKDDFTKVYNSDGRIWELLKILYQPGEEPFQNEILNGEYPDEIKKYILEKYKLVIVDGEIKRFTRTQLLISILKKNNNTLQSYFSSEDLFYLYMEECKNFPKLKVKTLRSFEGLVERCDNVVFSSGLGYRYYQKNIDRCAKQEISNIFKAIPDGAYNSNYIFQKFPEVMQKYDIRNGSELHNICKKFGIDDFISLGRNPEFVKGNFEKKYYIFENLLKYDNKTVEEFLKMMNNCFGLNISSLQTYLFTELREYLFDNYIYIDKSEYSELVVQIKPELTDELYVAKDFVKIILKYITKNELTPKLIFSLGYSISPELIYDKKYRSASEAIESQILANKVFHSDNYSYSKVSYFYSTILELERNFKILKISETDYLRVDFLEKRGFDTNKFQGFITKVEDKFSHGEYFSIISLINDGFTDDLLDSGFELITLDRLISISDKIKFVNNSFPHIFYKGNEKYNISHFLTDILCRLESANVEDFVDDINEKFGINLEEYDVRRRLLDEGAYYSAPLNKVYITKEDYLREVYGK
ncbi:sigma factor-like helix-turn-helix DNA-binding protein [Streptococcus phocae subsp. salmonis]